MKKLLLFAATLLFAQLPALAAQDVPRLLSFPLLEQSVTETYNLQTLTNTPGKIVVGTNVLTFVEFSDDIVQIASGRPDVLTSQVSEVNKAQLMLRANKVTDGTDLIVTLASGETALFVVTIDAKAKVPRRYLIKNNLVGVTNSSDPSSAAGRASTSPLPEWVAARADYTAYDNGDVVIQYAIQNKAETANLVAGSSNLTVYAVDNTGRKNLNFKLTRQGLSGGLIKPASSDYGVINIIGASNVKSLIAMDWQIINQKTNERTVYHVEFDIANRVSR